MTTPEQTAAELAEFLEKFLASGLDVTEVEWPAVSNATWVRERFRHTDSGTWIREAQDVTSTRWMSYGPQAPHIVACALLQAMQRSNDEKGVEVLRRPVGGFSVWHEDCCIDDHGEWTHVGPVEVFTSRPLATLAGYLATKEQHNDT